MYLCKKCDREYPRTKEFFHKSKQGKDGLHSLCKSCNRAKTSEYRLAHLDEVREKKKKYAEENPERIKELKHAEYERHRERYLKRSERQRAEEDPVAVREYKRLWAQAWRETHPGEAAEAAARWRLANPERQTENQRVWTETNREHIREVRRAHYRANPGLYADKFHRRQARKRLLPDDFTPEDWQYALQYWQYSCAVCGRQDGLFSLVLSMEHWIPLASPACPGTVPHNILPTCCGITGCNTRKRAKDPVAWLTEELGARKAKRKLKEIQAFFATVRRIDEGLLNVGD